MCFFLRSKISFLAFASSFSSSLILSVFFFFSIILYSSFILTANKCPSAYKSMGSNPNDSVHWVFSRLQPLTFLSGSFNSVFSYLMAIKYCSEDPPFYVAKTSKLYIIFKFPFFLCQFLCLLKYKVRWSKFPRELFAPFGVHCKKFLPRSFRSASMVFAFRVVLTFKQILSNISIVDPVDLLCWPTCARMIARKHPLRMNSWHAVWQMDVSSAKSSNAMDFRWAIVFLSNCNWHISQSAFFSLPARVQQARWTALFQSCLLWRAQGRSGTLLYESRFF